MTDDRVASLAQALELAMESILAKNPDAVIDYPDLARAALAWMEAGRSCRTCAHWTEHDTVPPDPARDGWGECHALYHDGIDLDRPAGAGMLAYASSDRTGQEAGVYCHADFGCRHWTPS